MADPLFCSIHQTTSNAACQVPLLVDGETTLVESNVVSEFLDRKFPDKGPQLFPTDPKELALVTAMLLLHHLKVFRKGHLAHG